MAISWKGSISFGLIYIPIVLHLAAGEESIGFNMLHKGCGGRVSYKKVCSLCGKELAKDDIIKGYSYEDKKYVTMTDDEFELLKSEKNKSITIEQFVSIEEIDPIYYERAYYVQPTGGEVAFELLRQAMEKENKVGLAKIVMGAKETLLALRANRGNVLVNTMYFANEIRTAPAASTHAVNAPELKMARTLINSMTAPFQPDKYHDEFQEKLRDALEQKIAGQQVVVEPQDQRVNNVVDLMEALQASLRAIKQRKTS